MSGQAGAAAPLGEWQLIGPPGGNAEVLASDPRQPATIYAGGRGGICRSRDGGRNWMPIISGLTHRNLRSIAIDPSDSSRLWVGTDGGGLFKSEDAGEHWLDANEGLRPARQRWWAMSVWSIAIHPTRPRTILIRVETVQAHTPQADFAGGIFKSVDGGRTWHSPRGFPLTRVSALAFDPKEPSVIYAGTFRCGVMKSIDGGETWLRLATTGSLDVRALRVAPSAPATIYAATLTAADFQKEPVRAVSSTRPPTPNGSTLMGAATGGVTTVGQHGRGFRRHRREGQVCLQWIHDRRSKFTWPMPRVSSSATTTDSPGVASERQASTPKTFSSTPNVGHASGSAPRLNSEGATTVGKAGFLSSFRPQALSSRFLPRRTRNLP
jgi:hypothetical protein